MHDDVYILTILLIHELLCELIKYMTLLLGGNEKFDRWFLKMNCEWGKKTYNTISSNH